MISLKMNEEQVDTLKSVIDILLQNQINGQTNKKHLKQILKKLEKKNPVYYKFCSYCFETYHYKNRISKDANKCWNCGRSQEGNYFGKTEFWISD